MIPTEPVRRIPISTRSITGQLGGNEFESALERDLLMQLAWDNEVASRLTQPVKIKYWHEGSLRTYTPDVLVTFEVGVVSGSPLLCEVKYRRELSSNWKELRRKFRAARRYCAECGWRFDVFTEEDIRVVRLENIKFLWRYIHSDINAEHAHHLLECLRHSKPLALAEIVRAVGAKRQLEYPGLVWTFWTLVAKKQIEFDVDRRIGTDTLFYVSGGGV